MQMWEDGHIKPEIIAERRDGFSVELDMCPDETLTQFQGHFPAHPICPGVAQLDWAVCFACEKFGIDIAVREVSQLKFREVLMPNMNVTLSLEYQPDKKRIIFSYSHAEKIFSSGILKLGSL